jgi:hypothetical protein
LVIDSKGRAKSYSNTQFWSDDEVMVRVKGANLILDLGFEDRQRKTATFDGKKLVISMAEQIVLEVPERECERIYVAGYSHCSSAPENAPENRCEEVGRIMDSKAAAGWLEELRRRPGYDAIGFERLCKAACTEQAGASYETFKVEVCTSK